MWCDAARFDGVPELGAHERAGGEPGDPMEIALAHLLYRVEVGVLEVPVELEAVVVDHGIDLVAERFADFPDFRDGVGDQIRRLHLHLEILEVHVQDAAPAVGGEAGIERQPQHDAGTRSSASEGRVVGRTEGLRVVGRIRRHHDAVEQRTLDPHLPWVPCARLTGDPCPTSSPSTRTTSEPQKGGRAEPPRSTCAITSPPELCAPSPAAACRR